MLTDSNQIATYLKTLGIESGFSIRVTDGSTVVDLNNEDNGIVYREPLRVQFGRVNGHFSVKGDETTPDTPKTSFVGFPHTITGCLSLFGSDFKNLSGIDKEIKFIGQEIVLNNDSTHMLGLLQIGGTGKFDIDRGVLNKIMNKYRDSQDVLSAQDELLDAGMIEIARF